MNLEEGDLVLCTVERIDKTIVFVSMALDGKEVEGSIITSEIAPGRIRNIRDYVVPKKKIVCKVLRISKSGNIELSFRRVTQKERKELMEELKQEKSYVSILKSVMGEDSMKIIEEIMKSGKIFDFFEDAKENPKKLEILVGKENSKKIMEILNTQKEKKTTVKGEIILKSTAKNGLETIKKILEKIKNAEVRYISAGRYSLKAESNNMKDSDRRIREIEKEIEADSKKAGAEFGIIEK